MKLLIATPAYGGMITTGYFLSFLETYDYLNQAKIENNVLTLANESLIPRGRNYCADYALRNGFTHLLFIDADLVWTWEKARMLVESGRDIVGGTYPVKVFPLTLNLNVLPEHKDIFGKDRQQDNYLELCKQADERGELEVKHIPTGFMMINCKVFATLAEKKLVKPYATYAPDKKQHYAMWDFFPSGVNGEQYLSEDWYFCHLAREAGYKIYLQTRAVCGHIGTHTYGLGQHVVLGQEPLIK